MIMRLFIFLLSMLLLSACNKTSSPGNETTKEESTTAEAVEATPDVEDGVSGYKDLRFGMTPNQIARTEVCDKSYRFHTGLDKLIEQIEKRKSAQSTPSNQFLIDSYRKRVAQENETVDYYKTVVSDPEKKQKEEPNTSLENLEKRLQYAEKSRDEWQEKLNQFEADAKAELDNPEERFKKDVQPLLDKYELIKNYDMSITDEWIKIPYLSCTADVMGIERRVELGLSPERKLNSITIELGGFVNDAYQSISQALSEKYSQSYEPTETQVAMFNEYSLDQIARTYANGQVFIMARNHRAYQRNDVSRKLYLIYADKMVASELSKLTSEGVVKSHDL